MKIPNELNNILRSTYKGSIVALADDISRFYVVKRLLRKQCLKNILETSIPHAKQIRNQVIVLFNTFGTYANVVFSYILEDDELEIYQNILFVLKMYFECSDNNFCQIFNLNVNNTTMQMEAENEEDTIECSDN